MLGQHASVVHVVIVVLVIIALDASRACPYEQRDCIGRNWGPAL